MPSTPDAMAEEAVSHLLQLAGPRNLVAIAGPPAAGKSTVADLIRMVLVERGRSATVVPMDGFHLDNSLLSDRGLLHRKGAPQTFDAQGFCHLVGRIAEAEAEVIYPVFDRGRDIAVAGAGVVTAEVEFILFEGNYLLLRDEPWTRLVQYWDYSIWIDAPLPALKARLMDRWRAEGLGEDAARERVDSNDLPNVERICEQSAAADLSLRAHA